VKVGLLVNQGWLKKAKVMNESFMNSTKSGLRRSEMQDGDEQTWFRNRIPQPLGEKQRWPPPSRYNYHLI